LGCLFTSRFLAAETVVVKNFDYERRPNILTFTSVPTKVVSLNGSTTEMMLRLGLEKHLIGTGFLDNPVMPDLREAYARIPVLSPRYPSKELVLYQEPDMIIGWRATFGPQALGEVHYWNRLGVKTFITRNSVLGPQKVAHFYDDLRDLGDIFNIRAKTDEFILGLEALINSIGLQLPPLEERPVVLIAEMAQHGQFRAFASNSLAGDMLRMAGGRNAFPKEGAYSMESLIQVDPDVIIVTHMLQDRASVEGRLEQIKAHPILRKLKAVRNGRLHSMPLTEVFSAGVRIPEGLKRLAVYLYPERFHYEPL